MTRNPFGWHYPPGAEHDPHAPWNQDHMAECEWCGERIDLSDSEETTNGTVLCQSCYEEWLEEEDDE